MFRSFQIIIREFRRSLLKLLHIHDLVHFYKQGVVAAYHVVWESVVECSWLGVRRMVRNEGLQPITSTSLCSIRRTPGQLHSLQQIPTQHDMLPQHLVYKNEQNRECVITLARNDEIP